MRKSPNEILSNVVAGDWPAGSSPNGLPHVGELTQRRFPDRDYADQERVETSTLTHTLIIEDNRDLARLFSDLLEVLGCTVSVAWRGDTGLAMAEQKIPDIIFCDVNMPGDKNGHDVAREIRCNKDFDDTWLVAITGIDDADSIAEAISAGFDRVFGKPIKYAQLKEIVETFSTVREPQ